MFVVMLSQAEATAQPRFDDDKSLYYNYGTNFYYDVISIPVSHPDSMRTIIIYKIAYNLLPFQKMGYKNDSLFTEAKVDAEFKSSDGVIRKRLYRSDTIKTLNYESTKSRTEYLYGVLEDTVLSDKYDIQLILSTGNNNILKRLQVSGNQLKLFKLKDSLFSPLLVTKMIAGNKEYYIPFILNGNLSFVAQNAHLIVNLSKEVSNNSYSYKIEKIKSPDNEFDLCDSLSESGTVLPVSNLTIHPMQTTNKKAPLQFELVKDLLNFNSIIDIEFPPSKILPGKYKLSIVRAGSTDTASFIFKIEWQDGPISIKRADYAVSMMHYILNDDEFNNMKSGSVRDIYSKIFAYWKKSDPTPYTAYNEAMSEYFCRVDYAHFNYQTLTEKDGARSDRGKIYILNGPAVSITQGTINDHAKETWSYPRLKKEYIFEVVSTGNYKLVKINDIK